jgi:hypothetical protein
MRTWACAKCEDAREPDAGQLGTDLDYVNQEKNEKVKILTLLRNSFYAHCGAKHVIKATDIGAQ